MTTTPFAPGARIEVRDAEWMVRTCTPTERDGYMIKAVGVSDFVRDEDAVFFTGIDTVKQLRPEDTELVADTTPAFAKSRLFLESVLRRTPLPRTEHGLALADRFLLDPLTYQQRPAELALRGLRPRILLADVVGLGKTLEIGLILAELIRRGRGERICVVTPQQVLEQFQHELWTRFAIPLVRLDSVGIERIQRDIPAGRNPFLYYKRIIISVDTLKNQGKYGQHLENMHWDAVVIDESHNLINEGSLRNRLARTLAPRTDALLLASATPHNGNAESFAQLISLLDPAAIANPKDYSAEQIRHLYIRRTKNSREVRDQIGGRWPDRGPSVPIRCAANAKEERIFQELTEVWLADPDNSPAGGRDRHLFPYTLLKAFLSSHKALASTAGRRLDNATDPREIDALVTLRKLAEDIGDDESTKRRTLIDQLRQIGVGRGRATRAVVFSESIPTLEWLAETVPGELGLTADQVRLMHGGCSDQRQQEIVEEFSLSDSKVRLLFTGDVASEGVNLHRQCHHLIHYDLPWSLIRIEQRNGRIDRYGQEHPPQFRALILTSAVEGAKDDTTVAEKLLKREEEAHRNLGTAEPVTGEFNAKKEEDRLIQALLDGKTVEQSLDETPPANPLAALFETVANEQVIEDPPRARVPTLFRDTEAFVREALRTVAPDLRIDDDGAMLAFEPPPDLVHRLSALPASYLRRHRITERMKVTFDRDLARRKLDEARRTKTMWPDIAYLSDLHPMVEWLVDKVQIQLVRQQAPVITVARPMDPTFLIQGIYSNALGQPTVVEWMAVTGLPGNPQIRDMTEVLAETRVGPDMINTLRRPDVDGLRELIVPAVNAARAHLDRRRDEYAERVTAPLREHRDRVRRWEQQTLDGLGDDRHAQRRRREVGDTVAEQERLLQSLETTGEPLLRILAVLEGDA
ncbi:DEAD/DEAH box helicase [Thermomonospora cellulosilytica]|uniref:Superfamily II DNA or RNA helicase n=1 Tax=Thermomonospora cellulosilytica TaxID=1411118 RepID=A0A7W3MVM1_9ACTN|nr:DEAD/DEAH box helicase [Thermomonospora cellulosilytica]MBA9002703.1 superfamily II DNA or RNA helicase [Thermomonospora cellulosilytica]